MVVDYKLGKIYALRSHETDDIYIGSTAQKLLSTRLGGHKRNYKRWLNGKDNYTTSFELIKYDDCYIELLQEYPCENRHQLCKKEGEYIRKMNCVNKLIAGRTNREWHQDNKENIQEYQKQYQSDVYKHVLIMPDGLFLKFLLLLEDCFGANYSAFPYHTMSSVH